MNIGLLSEFDGAVRRLNTASGIARSIETATWKRLPILRHNAQQACVLNLGKTQSLYKQAKH